MKFVMDVCVELVHIIWISRIINVHIMRTAGVCFGSNLILTTILGTKNFNQFNNSSVFYVYLFDAELSEDDLRKIETCRIISEL